MHQTIYFTFVSSMMSQKRKQDSGHALFLTLAVLVEAHVLMVVGVAGVHLMEGLSVYSVKFY